MKAHNLSLILIVLSSFTTPKSATIIQDSYIQRRILHQPLYPVASAPPPATDSQPPPPDSSAIANPDQPFFPEVPNGQTPDPGQPPPASAVNGTIPIPTATQPAKPAKKVAIAISVGIVTLGMLSALAFFLYRHRAKHPRESQKLVGGNSQRFADESRVPPSSFLYIGTVEPSRASATEVNGTTTTTNGANTSPYHRLNSIKRSDNYRPSPDLQPLPPLPKPPPPPPQYENENFPSPTSSISDEESLDTAFYTPQGSTVSNDDSYYTPVLVRPANAARNDVRVQATTSVPHSKRTSPKSRFSSITSPEMKHVIIPSIKQPSLAPPPPPPPPPLPHQDKVQVLESTTSYFSKRPKFPVPPPPPNMELLRSIYNHQSSKIPGPPPPPPPPPTSSAPLIPPSPPQSNSHMLPVSAPVLAGSYPLLHSDIASNSSIPSGDKLGTTGSVNEAIPLNQGGHSVPMHDGNIYLEGGSGTEVDCKLDEAKNFSQPSHLMVAAGSHMSADSDSDMEMEDDITQSDNDQAANHPIGDLTHCNHLIAGDSDIGEQLRELQSSAQSDAATLVLSVPGSSRLDNGQQVSEVHSPVINSAGADEKSSSRAMAAAGCENSDKYSSEVLKGGSPFRLLQYNASEDSSENNDEPYLKNTIPKTASKLVTVGSEDLQQQQPSYCLSHFATDNVYGLSGKIGSSSVLPPDILDSNQLSCLPNFAVSKNSTLPNTYPASFELPLNSKFSSDVLRQEKVASYTSMYDQSSSWNCISHDGQDASVRSRQPISSPSSARDVAQIIPRSGSDQYDPFLDSIEPTSNSFKRLDHIQKWESSNTDIMPRLSGSDKSLDVEENNKKEVRGIALSTSFDNEEFGETADAEVGDVEDQSQSNPVVVNVNMGDMEIDQVKSPRKSKNSKDSRSMKLFKVALADFVKEVLKPSWQQGNMSKEAFKTIVKKTVDKVAGAMKSHQIPKSKAKIDHYIDSSQWKLTKLVMGYVDKYAKG